MKVFDEYKYDIVTVLPNTALDLEAEKKNRRVRYIEPVGSIASLQGREKGKASADIANFSSTGAYTGANAQCVSITGLRLANYDKVFVASTSAPVKAYIVNDEAL